jgi:hypothetical protein
MNRHHAFDGAFCVVDSNAELGEVLASFVPGMAAPRRQLESFL